MSGTVRLADDSATGAPGLDLGLLILRLGLGVIFMAHGAQKVFGWFGGPGLEPTIAAFGRMGIPAPLAYLDAFTELLGGAAVLLGILTRIAGLGLAVAMIVAIAKVHGVNGFFLGGSAGPGYEYNLALIAMALALVCTGPGRFALADLEGRLVAGRRPPAVPAGAEEASIRDRAA